MCHASWNGADAWHVLPLATKRADAGRSGPLVRILNAASAAAGVGLTGRIGKVRQCFDATKMRDVHTPVHPPPRVLFRLQLYKRLLSHQTT